MELSQLFMLGLPADGDTSTVQAFQPGGVILMGRNDAPPAGVRRVTKKLETVLASPPLIAVDQEGGRVQRLKDHFTAIPSAREMAGQGARAIGVMASIAAAELRACGVNFQFAPVCDVPTHPDDTVIGDRAFSTDPLEAALCAAEWVRGAQPTVLCAAKHFPGHGGVGVDSHFGLPTFEGTRDDLDDHLGPFRATIGAGVASVMVGHIRVPSVDPSGAPASLSHPLITGVLRDEMDFRGLVITDDLDMGALSDIEAGESAVRALQAGCDLLLFCHQWDKARQAREAIQRALDEGRLSETRVKDAIERVQWAKRKLGLLSEAVTA